MIPLNTGPRDANYSKDIGRGGQVMTIRWQQLLVSLSLWLIAELFLNLVGIDDLVDYSEYIFDRHAIVMLRSSEHPPLFFCAHQHWVDS